MMRGKVCCVVAVLALLALAEGQAAAQPRSDKTASDQRARELFQKGDTAYAEGRYEEALAAFQEAYELSGRPQLLFNLSNVFERLGRYAEAVDALEKYLASGKANSPAIVQKRLAAVKKRAEEQKKEDERKASAKEKEKEDEAKKRAEAEPRRAEAPPAAAPTPRPTEHAAEQPSRLVPIVLLAAGGALLVTGGVFGALTLSARGDVASSCKDGPAGKLCTADAQGAIDREKTFGIIADIGLLSGLVCGGVGAYLLFTERRPDASAHVTARTPSVRLTGRSGGGGVEVVGSF